MGTPQLGEEAGSEGAGQQTLPSMHATLHSCLEIPWRCCKVAWDDCEDVTKCGLLIGRW
jgi:hypothetical protein